MPRKRESDAGDAADEENRHQQTEAGLRGGKRSAFTTCCPAFAATRLECGNWRFDCRSIEWPPRESPSRHELPRTARCRRGRKACRYSASRFLCAATCSASSRASLASTATSRYMPLLMQSRILVNRPEWIEDLIVRQPQKFDKGPGPQRRLAPVARRRIAHQRRRALAAAATAGAAGISPAADRRVCASDGGAGGVPCARVARGRAH